ncbi:hypothetical protein ACJMK2_041514 [Sinanodonta woodiana]|uniref:Uncharacterized protein n=1 Tax=Sinanodonta woodiana TaxID=1069815 RepID=A0ABD3W7D2_SINWO
MSDNNKQLKNACSICLDPYDKPKILQCFHTFCTKCLQDIIRSTGQSGSIHCPLCRTVIQVPKNGVEGFQTNFYINVSDVPSMDIIKCSGETSAQYHANILPKKTYHVVLSCCESGTPLRKCVVTVHYTTPGKCPTPLLKRKLSATAVELTWQGPEDNGGSPIIQYMVRMIVIDNGTYDVYNGAISSCKVSGLTGGRLHMFTVRAENVAGSGAWSDSLELVTDLSPPEEPKDLTIEEITSSSIVFSWTEPECNGAEITEFITSVNSLIRKIQVDHANKSPQYREKFDNLSPVTSYEISVQAVNRIGRGQFCGSKSCVTLAGKPSPVTGIEIEARTMTTVTLKWKQPNSNGSKIIGYQMYLNNNKEIIIPNKRRYKIRHLQKGTVYNISFRAMNSEGLSDQGVIFTVQTLDDPKPIPTGLRSISSKSSFEYVSDSALVQSLHRTVRQEIESNIFEEPMMHPPDRAPTYAYQYLERYNAESVSTSNGYCMYDLTNIRDISFFELMSQKSREIDEETLTKRKEMDLIIDEVVTESFGFTRICNDFVECLAIFINVSLVMAILYILGSFEEYWPWNTLLLPYLYLICPITTRFRHPSYGKMYYYRIENVNGNTLVLPWEFETKYDLGVYVVKIHNPYFGCKEIKTETGLSIFPSSFERSKLRKDFISRLQSITQEPVQHLNNAIRHPVLLQIYIYVRFFLHYSEHLTWTSQYFVSGVMYLTELLAYKLDMDNRNSRNYH